MQIERAKGAGAMADLAHDDCPECYLWALGHMEIGSRTQAGPDGLTHYVPDGTPDGLPEVCGCGLVLTT